MNDIGLVEVEKSNIVVSFKKSCSLLISHHGAMCHVDELSPFVGLSHVFFFYFFVVDGRFLHYCSHPNAWLAFLGSGPEGDEVL